MEVSSVSSHRLAAPARVRGPGSTGAHGSIDEAASAAQAAFGELSELSVSDRKRVIAAMRDAARAEASELARRSLVETGLGRFADKLKKHELAVRSGMLGVLADTPEEDVYSLDGKKHLQKRLTGAINEVLTENEGFGGVDAVYFKTFIIQ